MAIIKAVDSEKLDADLKAIGDSIREKAGTQDQFRTAQAMADAIMAIKGGDSGNHYTQFVIDLFSGKVTELETPLLGYIAPSTFRGWNLKSANFPNVTEIGDDAFCGAGKLTTCNTDSVEIMGHSVFQNCRSLQKLDFPKLSKMGYHCFYDTKSLKTLIIRTNKVVALAVPFGGSAINEGTGFVYVPKSLVEQYKVATNWSKVASQFRAIEDYPEITGG